MDFETLYSTMVERCSHETAFNKEEAKALWELAQTLDSTANVVEIGVEFGRSTTILGQCAEERGFSFTAIDAWVGEYGPYAREHVEDILISEWGLPIDLWSMPSLEASFKYYKPVDLIHIDGDHTYDAVLDDCFGWLHKVVNNGYACFDDYGRTSLPEVFEAVTTFMSLIPVWKPVGHYGNKFGVFQKCR